MSQTVISVLPVSPAIPASNAPGRLLRAYRDFARREMLACGVVLLLTLAIRGALLPVFPPPVPVAHDEFSYLLAGETYAAGRLANPPLPFWEHFETFHELMQPVYAPKYPVLQGMVLAFGQKFFGQPWVGVYLSAGLMCAAVCWMLQGWISAEFALLGALLFMLRIGIFSSWMNSYWGGSVAAVGGSLLLGAAARLLFRRQTGHLVTAGLGMAILMHSRPWEGAMLSTMLCGVLAWHWRKWVPESRAAWMRPAAGGVAMVLASLAAVAYIDYRVTGNPLVMPHMLYTRQYIMAPLFAFQQPRPEPVYRHHEFQVLFASWHLNLWRNIHSDPLTTILGRFSDLYKFFFGFWPLLIPPLLWPYPLKSDAERITAVLLALFLLFAVAPMVDFQPHYSAPIVGLFFLRFVQTLRRLHHWRPLGRPVGWAAAAFFAGLFAYGFTSDLYLFVRYRPPVSEFATQRTSVIRQLEQQPGKQLVLVRYTPQHNVFDEWVHNAADLKDSRIVWAHEMGPAEDGPFLEHFRERRAWLLEADANPPRLVPYTERNAPKETASQ